jgi:hypothetical protein
MNVAIRTEAAQFPEKEYINGIFVAVQYASSPKERLHGYTRGLKYLARHDLNGDRWLNSKYK